MPKNTLTLEVEKLKKEFYDGINRLEENHEKMDRQMADFLKSQQSMDKRIGDFFNGFGDFVEGLLAPSIPPILQKMGIHVNVVITNQEVESNGDSMEIDVLCKGTKGKKKVVVAAEIKSKVTVKDVEHFIDNLERFFHFFDEYKGRDLIGVISGVRFPKEVVKYAQRKGLYTLGASNNVVTLLNKTDFQPKIWR